VAAAKWEEEKQEMTIPTTCEFAHQLIMAMAVSKYTMQQDFIVNSLPAKSVLAGTKTTTQKAFC
jgi:hypothetical protein